MATVGAQSYANRYRKNLSQPGMATSKGDGGGTALGASGLGLAGGRDNPSRPVGNIMSPSQVAAAIGITPSLLAGNAANRSAAAAMNTGANQSGYVPSPAAPGADLSNVQLSGSSGATPANRSTPTGGPQGAFTTASLNAPAAVNSQIPGTGSLTTNGTDPMDWRFAGSDTSYSARDLENILNNLDQFQLEFLKSRGLDSQQATGALGSYADRIDPLSIALYGGRGDTDAATNPETRAGIYESMLANYTTPGGRRADVGEILNLLNQNSGSIATGGAGSNALNNKISGGSAQDQISNVNSILGAALAGTEGSWGNAWANQLNNLSQGYTQSQMDAYGGPNQTYFQWLMQNSPDLAAAMGR